MAKPKGKASKNAWKANRFKGKQFTKNVEKDLSIYIDDVLKNCAKIATEVLEDEYSSLINSFYEHYSPEEYRHRAYGLKNTASQYIKNAGGGVHVGGLILSAENMLDGNYYMHTKANIKNAGWALKDIIFDVTVIQGEHGRPENFGLESRSEWYYTPSVYEQIVDFRDTLVQDLNAQYDRYDIIGRAQKMTRTKHLKFLQGGR